MPLASSVDKDKRTETLPFIEALSYRHNNFWHSHLVHAKPTYNISFHTSTHYGYPYTPSTLNSSSTELQEEGRSAKFGRLFISASANPQ